MTGPPRSASWQGRRLAFLGVFVALLAAACVPVAPVEQLPPPATNSCVNSPPTTPAAYQAMFDGLRTQWTEWAAADGSIPVDLRDGRTLWLFGDTITGRVRTDGSIAPGWGFVHDSAVLQAPSGKGTCVTPLMGGVRGARTDFIPNPTTGDWYWPTGGVVENGGKTLRVFMYDVAPDSSQPAPFNWKIKQIDVATYSLPDLVLTATPVSLFPSSLNVSTPFGEKVVDGGDGYLYAYGHTGQLFKTDAKHYVARIPIGTETSATPSWEFWSGGVWSPLPALAGPMLFDPDGSGSAVPADNQGPYDALGVIPYTDSHGVAGFLATAKVLSSFDDQISTWFSPTLTGPWSFVGFAKTGQPTGSTYTYAAQFVTAPGPMLIWSQNHTPMDPDVIANSTLYKAFYANADPGALP